MNQFVFSTVSFVPSSVRDDRLNVALVVFDPSGPRYEMRVLRGLRSKLRAVGGQADPASVEDVIDGLRSELNFALPNLIERWSPPGVLLERLHATWVNQIQVSSPGQYRATSFRAAVDQLGSIHLAGAARQGSGQRSRREVRREIKSTISKWELGPYRLEEQRIRTGPDKVAHQADFWLVNGQVDAALYAFAPDSELNAIVLRDSLPTVLTTFREANEGFQVVAVTVDEPPPGFAQAARYLRQRGVVVTTATELDALRPQLLHGALL
jgi:hypothetical protein